MSHKERWTFKLTPFRYVLLTLGLAGAALSVYRLAFGLGSVTNLNDQWPWGLWIGFDVLTGVALAGGGYSTCLLVYVLRIKKFKPVARSAMLTSLIGYLLVLAGLFLDIGRWYNFWRPFVYWGYHSVLFEVFWCVSLYTTVQLLEFSHVITERVGRKWHNTVVKILPVLFIIGIVLPTLHQSSLGTLYVIEVGKLHPLWWSMLLPAFFLLSSFFVGPAMVGLETTLGGKAHGGGPDPDVLRSMTRVSAWLMLVYLALKVIDLIYRGAVGFLLDGSLESNMFLLEMLAGVVIPLAISFSPLGRSRAGLTAFSVLVAAGVVINRMNVVFTGMRSSLGGSYIPSPAEWLVSAGLVSLGVLAYLFIVENFEIMPANKEQSHAYDPSPLKAGGKLSATYFERGK
ncbi:MAG: Ni/Fe-hydrogenase cytochrome b subunit [Firmicutes bacterium]|nr:Ni/Fe-hydrogenase cytochrome b subunit [Bacillota bacterium]